MWKGGLGPNRAQASASGFPTVSPILCRFRFPPLRVSERPLCPGTATVWFDQQLVFGHAADDGRWTHPSHDCGRDMVPVPPEQGREAKWSSTVDSRSQSLAAASESSRVFSRGIDPSNLACRASVTSARVHVFCTCTSQAPEVGKSYVCCSDRSVRLSQREVA